jgi:carotenoid cleavage dioxygenase
MTEPVAAPQSPYLEGNYAPVPTEIAADNLKVIGEIPPDLAGTFVRNGSNPRFAPKGRYHWFDGDGMVHGVHIARGAASYRNRWVRTKAFLEEEREGRPLWTGVTERPDFSNPRGPFKDTANTDLVYHAGKLLALWWLGGEPYHISVPDLETCGVMAFGDRMPAVTAHPKVDPMTGEMIIFDYKPFPPYFTHAVVSPDGALSHVTTVDFPGPRLQHDIAITERYTLLFDMSMMWDPDMLAKGKIRVRFYRDKPTRIGVLPRRGAGSEVRWFEVAPCYMYHAINAWEEGDSIVLIGGRIEHPLADDPANPKGIRDVPTIGFLRLEPRLHRWRLNLTTGQATEEPLDDILTEFPRMDNRRLGRRSRYAYSPLIAHAPTVLFEGFVKYDTERSGSATHRYAKGWFGGEVVFAPRAGSKEEDDGYLVTFVVEEATGTSELHVIDARDVTRGPVARVLIPQRVPTGYHAWWVPMDEAMAAE